MSMPGPWTQQKIKILKILWSAGHSASEIAHRMGTGFTRNSIIGKAHRLKLNSRASPIFRKNKKIALKYHREDFMRENTPLLENDFFDNENLQGRFK